ncbi:MAG: hypothetical protein GC162_02785 [Planctomycetes bacterium]|nr:hypothetical protein [Planctomycetota bacterium]
MTKRELKALKKHYREWSGGFSPESDHAITVYLDYAVSVELDRDEAEAALWEWLEADDPDSDLPPWDRMESAVEFYSFENMRKFRRRLKDRERRLNRHVREWLLSQGFIV